jgi:hypothetical protein
MAAHISPGVYSILDRLDIKRLVPTSVRTFTQVGGHLDHQTRWRCYNATERGGRFYVMYGQTEAGPRITTLQSDEFPCRLERIDAPQLCGVRAVPKHHRRRIRRPTVVWSAGRDSLFAGSPVQAAGTGRKADPKAAVEWNDTGSSRWRARTAGLLDVPPGPTSKRGAARPPAG